MNTSALQLASANAPAGDPSTGADSRSDRAEFVARATLSASERRELFTLLDAHFEGVTAAQFANDLDGKDFVLRVRRGDRLVGFSTVQLCDTVYEGRRVNVVYSGDTIMSPETWGSPVLARGWIAMIRSLQQHRSSEPWYWLLLSSGFRTYRFLPVFWRAFWPRYDEQTPSDAAQLLAQLAMQKFGDAFDPVAGVVRFEHPQRLRGALAAIPDAKRHDLHVAFFLKQNPGHLNGDELVCLTELGDHNLTAAGARMVRGTACP